MVRVAEQSEQRLRAEQIERDAELARQIESNDNFPPLVPASTQSTTVSPSLITTASSVPPQSPQRASNTPSSVPNLAALAAAEGELTEDPNKLDRRLARKKRDAERAAVAAAEEEKSAAAAAAAAEEAATAQAAKLAAKEARRAARLAKELAAPAPSTSFKKVTHSAPDSPEDPPRRGRSAATRGGRSLSASTRQAPTTSVTSMVTPTITSSPTLTKSAKRRLRQQKKLTQQPQSPIKLYTVFTDANRSKSPRHANVLSVGFNKAMSEEEEGSFDSEEESTSSTSSGGGNNSPSN